MAAGSGAAAVVVAAQAQAYASSYQQQQQQPAAPVQQPPYPQQGQPAQQPWARIAQLQAAGGGLLQATAAGTGSGDWSELRNVIRNPAAALSSLTTRLGSQLQPG